MYKRLLHITRRVGCLAAMLLPLVSAGGCALWNKDVWNPNSYRDERAVDIDQRLDKAEPIVKNPF
jgi:hypothetical protein